MNVKITKRILTGALALTLAMAPSVGAFAKTTSSAAKAPTTTYTYAAEVVDTFAHVKSTSTVAGVKSSVNGAYILEKGIAAAITTPAASIAQSYALAAGETPYIKVFDMDVKKSSLAKASLDIAAAAFGGTNVGYIQMEIGKMSKGQYSLLPAGAGIAATFSIPKEALADGARFAVVRVVEGGAYTLLEDTDNNPATVSFVTTGGAGAYSIIKY